LQVDGEVYENLNFVVAAAGKIQPHTAVVQTTVAACAYFYMKLLLKGDGK